MLNLIEADVQAIRGLDALPHELIAMQVGRQPWIIQDLMPVNAAVSQLPTGNVMLTFFIFLILFTTLLIAELRIMINAIKNHKSE